MLTEWNRTKRAYDRRCLHELIADQAERSPGRSRSSPGRTG